MKKAVLGIAISAILLLMCTVSVGATSQEELLEEQLEAAGIPSLYDALPEETKQLLSALGMDELSFQALAEMQPQTVLSSLVDLLSEEAQAPCAAALLLIGTLLILGLISAIQPTDGDCGALFRTICMLAAITPLLVPLWQTMERVQAVSDSASAFSLGFSPIYAATLAAGGYAASAVSYQTVMLAAAQGLSVLSGSVVVPLLSVSLSLGIAGAMDPSHRLNDIGLFVNKTAVWLLTGMLTVFVGLLSLQSVLSSAADTVGGRVLRFSVAGFVPIVGGSLAEVLYTVRGCLSALRGTVGGFGMLCAALIVLPTLLECIVWNLLLTAAKSMAELFSLSQIAAVTDIVKGIVRVMIAVLSASSLLMIISVTVVTLSGGGAT